MHAYILQGYLDARVEAKYEEIIAHLQRALNSSEEDEGDFKKHAKTLQDLVEQLSASKADRRELLELKQFVVSLNDSHGGGSRRRSSSGDASLTGSITRDEVFNLLEEKIGRRDLERRLALLNTRLNALTRGAGEQCAVCSSNVAVVQYLYVIAYVVVKMLSATRRCEFVW